MALYMKKLIKVDECLSVSYEDSPEIHKQAFDKLIEWYLEHKLFHGESICQCDTGNIESVTVVSNIADEVINFETHYKE